MNAYTYAVSLAMFVCCYFPSNAWPPGAQSKPRPAAIPPNKYFSPLFLPDSVTEPCDGYVVEITRDSITIDPGPNAAWRGPGLRKFHLGPHLDTWPASSRFEPGMYLLSDLKLGDKVDIDFHRISGRAIFDGICILRRPGGKIPKARVEDLRARFRHHDYCQAHQDWEEKGIPLPKKYILAMTPVDPRELIEAIRQMHTAPMPRAVKRGR